MNSRTKKVAVLLVILNLALCLAVAFELSDQNAVRTIMGKSMQHGEERQLGILDNADGFVMAPLGPNLLTYYGGLGEGYRSAGDWGDVIVFRTGAVRTVHRLVCYVEFNNTSGPVTADIPELGIYGVQEFGLKNYGFARTDVLLDFPLIYDQMVQNGQVVIAGYITKGDNNVFVDQQRTTVSLVTKTDILGVVDEVYDNELVLSSGLQAIILLALIGIAVGSFALWFRWGDDWLGRGVLPATLTWCIMFLNLGFTHNTAWVTGNERWSFLWLAFVPLLMFLGMKLLDRFPGDRYTRAALPLSLFILVYFLFLVGLHTFLYSILALTSVLCLYALSPAIFFSDLSSKQVESEYGTWQICTGLSTMLLISVFMTSLPVWFYLGIAVVIGNAVSIHSLVRMRASGKPLDSSLQKVVT